MASNNDVDLLFRLADLSPRECVAAALDALPDTCALDDVRYLLEVVGAVRQGLADVSAGRYVPHHPLVRRTDREVANFFRHVVWTLSAHRAVERTFGAVFERTPQVVRPLLGQPADPTGERPLLLEKALDASVSHIVNLGRSAVQRAGETIILYGQGRLIYRVGSEGAAIIAVVPSLAEWSKRLMRL